MYPVIKCESKKPQDVVESLRSTKLNVTPQLDETLNEVESRIKNIEAIGMKGLKY